MESRTELYWVHKSMAVNNEPVKNDIVPENQTGQLKKLILKPDH